MVTITGGLFLDLGLVIIIAAAAAYILRLLKQPQILAYVLVGILVTPTLGVEINQDIINSMSIIGIAFLLFIVGLEMDIKSLRSVSLVSTLGGTIQIIILIVLGYVVSLFLGLLSMEAAYVGLFIAFSSTMVVMKLLSDKKELNTLHGRIVIGILLMEDIVAIFALSVLSSINGFSTLLFIIALIKFFSLFGLAYIASKFIFPTIFKFAAKYHELLLISSLAVCFMFSLVFQYLGFSIAIGAFVAGIALGNLDYSLEIISKVKGLKDFFALIFFVSLGMGISIDVLEGLWLPLLVILAVVLFLKPLVTMFICLMFKYTKKPSFMTASSLAQTGEFSLIIAAQGLFLGHISKDLFSIIVVVTLLSIIVTSYYIQYNQRFYKIFVKPMKFFDFFTTEGLEYLPTEIEPKYVLCGHNRIGYSILKSLHKVKKRVLVVDYNPEIISKMVDEGYHCIYGEVTDDEIIERMNLKKIKLLISTVPSLQDNLVLIRKIREDNKKAKIFVTANDIEESLKLYEKGASYVILPHFLGGEHVAGMISNIHLKKIDLTEERKKHIEHLEERKKIGHDHPKGHH